jgi:hypothetical protein
MYAYVIFVRAGALIFGLEDRISDSLSSVIRVSKLYTKIYENMGPINLRGSLVAMGH